MKNRNEQIFVRVMKNGFIPHLGICGPIPNPIKVTRAIAHSMVVSGVEVHEVDPVTKMTKKLTIHNVFNDEEPVKEKPVETPVTTNTPVTPTTFSGVAKEEQPQETEKVEETTVENESDKVAEQDEAVTTTTSEDVENTSVENTEKAEEVTTQTQNNNYKGKNKKHK